LHLFRGRLSLSITLNWKVVKLQVIVRDKPKKTLSAIIHITTSTAYRKTVMLAYGLRRKGSLSSRLNHKPKTDLAKATPSKFHTVLTDGLI
ncbi:hypothetical protein TELCIR_02318, partial [Teladorsagia circumcincta]